MRYDVTIVGGGVVGCALARELARYRVQVLLLERESDVGFGTSKANSGIVHGGHRSPPGTLKGRLEYAGNRRWESLAADLGFGFRRNGDLTVATTDGEVDVLRSLLARGEANGVPGLELWEPPRIRREEPNLAPEIVAALHAPTSAVVNPYEACFALVESACRNGVELRLERAVTGIATDGEGLVLETTRGPVASRFVVNAAGVFADRVAAFAGTDTFGLRVRKGEEYLLDRRLEGIVRRTIYGCPTPTSKGVLVIPTYDGTVMVGPTAEEVDDREDLTTTAAGAEDVFRRASRLVPGISARDCIAEFAGLRAVADTEDFVIGPTSVRGFVNAAGIQSPGLTAAPAIAELVVEILRDGGLVLEEDTAFVPGIERPVRVAAMSPTELSALAASDPRFAHVVCRCELVTEGEVAEAMARGARTLDGVKFRTRAGMGRCQGGFCTSRCMELLAKAFDVRLPEVTKRGPGSWLVLDKRGALGAAREEPS
ncbi:MAG: NAD(P)/FAD-dependent oxidoreductase [Acidimicrobiia bacterium]